MSDQKSFREQLRHRGVLVVGICGPIGSGKTTLCETIADEFDGPVYFRNFADALKEQIAAHHNIPLQDCYTREGKSRVIATTGHTVGRTLQLWGTALRDGVAPHIWIVALQSWVEKSVLPQCETCADKHWSNNPEPLLTRRDGVVPLLCSMEQDATHDDDEISGVFPKDFAHQLGYHRPQAIVFIGDVRLPNEFDWVRDTCGGMLIELQGDPARARACEAQSGTRDMNHVSETALADKEVFDADLIVDTDELDRSTAAACVIDSLTLFAMKTNHQDCFFEFYHQRLRPLIDKIVALGKRLDGDRVDSEPSVVRLYNATFHNQDIFALFGHSLVSHAAQWADLQCYVNWLATKADVDIIHRCIAPCHSIFNRRAPYTRFLKYAKKKQ
jgi:hypothetical protein